MIKFLIHQSSFDRFEYSVDTNNITYAWEIVKNKFPEAEHIEII